MRGSRGAIYEALQLQFGPQLQASPHSQPVRFFALASWQPHLQVAPAQDAHLQTFDLFDIENLLFDLFDLRQHKEFAMTATLRN